MPSATTKRRGTSRRWRSRRYGRTFGTPKARSGRQLALLIVAGLAFFLLIEADVDRVTLGFLRVDDFELLLKLLPSLVAFTYFELLPTLGISGRYRMALNFVLLKIRPEFAYANLEHLLGPPNPTDVFDLVYASPGGKLKKTERFFNLTHGFDLLGLFVAPIAVLVYAYVRIFAEYGAEDPAVWLSVVVGCIYVVRAWTVRPEFSQ